MIQDPVIIVFDFMVIFIVLSCIYFIYDINTPFSGYITVSPDVFEKVHAKMLFLK
jgi:predicted aspartyl protease